MSTANKLKRKAELQLEEKGDFNVESGNPVDILALTKKVDMFHLCPTKDY